MKTYEKKCYYIAATVNDKSFYIEGEYTDSEIDQYINHFDINDFMSYADEEFAMQCENGHYVVHAQSMITSDEAVDLGVARKIHRDNDEYTIVFDYPGGESAKTAMNLRQQQMRDEIESQYGEYGLICKKAF
jgi:hypothetical protein